MRRIGSALVLVLIVLALSAPAAQALRPDRFQPGTQSGSGDRGRVRLRRPPARRRQPARDHGLLRSGGQPGEGAPGAVSSSSRSRASTTRASPCGASRGTSRARAVHVRRRRRNPGRHRTVALLLLPGRGRRAPGWAAVADQRALGLAIRRCGGHARVPHRQLPGRVHPARLSGFDLPRRPAGRKGAPSKYGAPFSLPFPSHVVLRHRSTGLPLSCSCPHGVLYRCYLVVLAVTMFE